MTQRPYHHGNLRRALLDAAERAIAETGVDGLSLRGLARDAGVTHGAPAKHFRDKQALLDALALDGFQRLHRLVTESVEAGTDHRSRLTGAARAYVGFAVAHHALLELMFTRKHHPDADASLRENAKANEDMLLAMLRDAHEAGVRLGENPERTAMIAMATVHGVAVLAAGNLLGATPVDEAVTAAVDLVWSGLTAPSKEET